MEFWKEIFVIVFSPVAVIIIFVYFFRRTIEQALKKFTIKFESDLSKNISLEIERFRSELEKQRIEDQTKFSLLHRTRMEVVRELFGFISKAERKTGELLTPDRVSPLESPEEKKAEALDAIDEAERYYDENRIYFEYKIKRQIISVLNHMSHSIWVYDRAGEEGVKEENAKKILDMAWREFTDELLPAKQKLESMIQVILGSGEKEDPNIGNGV